MELPDWYLPIWKWQILINSLIRVFYAFKRSRRSVQSLIHYSEGLPANPSNPDSKPDAGALSMARNKYLKKYLNLATKKKIRI